MVSVLKKVYRLFLSILPDKLAMNIDYFRGYKRFINYKNPRFFGEKLNYLKLYGNMQQYREYVDKFEVRKYIKNKIGSKYLIPLISYYQSGNDIDFEKLPNSFVLKLNYGSGYNIIVPDKKKINNKKIARQLDRWIKEDYYKIKKEYQYKDIDKKILVEKYIVDKEGKLNDYKFFCFSGKCKFFKVDFDRFTNHKCNYYDSKLNFMPIREAKFKNDKDAIVLPDNIETMIDLANKLSSDFNFVRVDLYDVDGRIYFGELTFTPAAGLNPFFPLEKDLEIASYIDLKK